MNRFSVNLSTIFTEVPFIERFKLASEHGFNYVECQFPYEQTVANIKTELDAYKQTLVLINLPPGDWAAEERGLAIFPERKQEFMESVENGIRYAKALGVKTIHCMAGVLPEGLSKEVAYQTYLKNITYAANQMSKHDITLVIEPINSFDMPNYFLSNLHTAIQVIEEIALPNVKLQYDFYHIQKIQGNLISTFMKYKDYIHHIQIADVPNRHEPGTGEIHYDNIFTFIEKANYIGKIGLEYSPKNKSENSFEWIKKGGL